MALIKKLCKLCNSVFIKYASRAKNRACDFCSRNCYIEWQRKEWKKNNPSKHIDLKGEKNPMWGKIGHGFNPNGNKRKDGYIRVSVGHSKRVLKHRLLAEQKIKRKLEEKEIVHHINGDNTDNRLSNLMVITQAEHCQLHFTKAK